MSASKLQGRHEVRIEHSLNQNEEKFVKRRGDVVFHCLKKLKIHCSRDKVPNIALLGSGGGQRTMVALLGSLVQLGEAGLLDCVLYLSGISGSTWCMASLYQEPDWSSKLEEVKDKIVHRLSGPEVGWKKAYAKLKKYYKEKDFISLTDFWAVKLITKCVKEIDEHTLSDQWKHNKKAPYPIYTVIDKGCKQKKEGDPWVEITPHEAGYSLTGAFVKTCDFGCQFQEGSKKKQKPQMDMLYLQAMCGSALADGDEIKKYLWEKIKEFFKNVHDTEMLEETDDSDAGKCYEVLLDLVDMNLAFLNGKTTDTIDETIKHLLKEIYKGKKLIFPDKELPKEQYMHEFTEDVCQDLTPQSNSWPTGLRIFKRICFCMAEWIWGRNYDFLYNMTTEAVPPALEKSETRDFIDAGLLINSPYFTVLRKERKIDLIISLDFSDGHPFKTVTETAETCKKLNIPFPEVHIPHEDMKKPKDFYVFRLKNAPTVIHIPLFNQINCGDKLEEMKKKYRTFQGPYSAEKIRVLLELAGKNISNNREKLKEEIHKVIGEKTHK